VGKCDEGSEHLAGAHFSFTHDQSVAEGETVFALSGALLAASPTKNSESSGKKRKRSQRDGLTRGFL
jgi:hypothetical protein